MRFGEIVIIHSKVIQLCNFCNFDPLKSLPKREMICGYAEILKHSLIKDKIFFKFLKKNFIKILSHNHKVLKKTIYKSCFIKKEIVEKDEKEKNIRKVWG